MAHESKQASRETAKVKDHSSYSTCDPAAKADGVCCWKQRCWRGIRLTEGLEIFD